MLPVHHSLLSSVDLGGSDRYKIDDTFGRGERQSPSGTEEGSPLCEPKFPARTPIIDPDAVTSSRDQSVPLVAARSTVASGFVIRLEGGNGASPNL